MQIFANDAAAAVSGEPMVSAPFLRRRPASATKAKEIAVAASQQRRARSSRMVGDCHVSYTREQLTALFEDLDTELRRLKSAGRPEEELWDAFERLVHVPAIAVDHRDRLWWWDQVYDAMEHHGLTELSSEHMAG